MNFKPNKKILIIIAIAVVVGATTTFAIVKSINKFDPTAFGDNVSVQKNEAIFSDDDLNGNSENLNENEDSKSDEQENSDNSDLLKQKNGNDKISVFNKQAKFANNPNIQKITKDTEKNNLTNNKNVVITSDKLTQNDSGYSSKNNSGNGVISNDKSNIKTAIDDNKFPNGSNISNNNGNKPNQNKFSAVENKSRDNKKTSHSSGGHSSNNGGSGDNNGDNSGGSSDNNGNDANNGDSGGGNGSDPKPPDKPDVPTKPDGPVQPDNPSSAPDPEPSLPKDIYDGVLDVEEFPSNNNGGDSGSGEGSGSGDGSDSDDDTGIASGGSLLIITEDYDDTFESIYYGQELTDWKLLCAMYAYYFDPDGKIYRITEINPEYFRFGQYPKVATDNFDVEVSFRANKKADWITQTATVKVSDCKVFIKDCDGEIIATKILSLGESVDLLDYYPIIQTEVGRLSKLLVGWTKQQDHTGDIISVSYTPVEKGKTVLYAMPLVDVDEAFDVQVEMNWGNYFPKKLQTLISYTGSSDILDVPNGVQSLEVFGKFSEIKIPQSIIYVDYYNFGYVCKDKYEVSEHNPNYSSFDGMLLNKDRTTILDIPVNMEEVNIPESVDFVYLSYNNSIKKIVFNTNEPPTVDVSYLNDADIVVPDDAYYLYLNEWGGSLGTNRLISEGNMQDKFEISDKFIMSKDGETLYAVLELPSAILEVPKTVKTVMAHSFVRNNKSTEIVVFGDNISYFESNVFYDSSVKVVEFKGENPPDITEDTFIDDSDLVVYVPKGCKQKYVDKWADIIGRDVCEKLISDEEIKFYEDANGSLVYEGKNKNILLKFANDIETFDQSYLDKNSLHIDEIGSYAFAGCDKLVIADIPESIKEIGKNAFTDCTALELVVIGSTDNIRIGYNSFANCTALKILVSNALNAEFVDGYVIYGKTLRCTVPNAIGYDVYWNLWDKRYYIADINGNKFVYGEDDPDTKNGQTIPPKFVRGASLKNYDNVELLDNTMEIGPSVFQGETELHNIKLPDTVYLISEYAFEDTGLKEIVIPRDMNLISYSAFRNCDELERVKINSTNYLKIQASSFGNCENLKYVEFAEDAIIDTIYTEAFYYSAIEEITLPENVNDIEANLFYGCDNLKMIRFTSEKPVGISSPFYGQEFSFDLSKDTDEFRIEVPKGAEQDYIDSWKYLVWAKNISELTEEDLRTSENIIRTWLGLELLPAVNSKGDLEDMTEVETGTVTEETTETTDYAGGSDSNGLNGSNSSDEKNENTESTTDEIDNGETANRDSLKQEDNNISGDLEDNKVANDNDKSENENNNISDESNKATDEKTDNEEVEEILQDDNSNSEADEEKQNSDDLEFDKISEKSDKTDE